MVEYLFNSSGKWIAFRIGKYIYNPNGKWVGWLPWGDNEVVDVNGKYLGHICYGSRIFKKYYTPYRGYPGYPGYPGYCVLPPGATDVTIEQNE